MSLIEKSVVMKDEMLAWQCGFHANSELGFKEENIAEFVLQVYLRQGTKFIGKFAVPFRGIHEYFGDISVWRISTGGNENDNN